MSYHRARKLSFNSIVVRLKVGYDLECLHLEKSFNSIVVRLKVCALRLQ